MRFPFFVNFIYLWCMKKNTVLPDGDGNYSSPERDCQRQKRAEGNEGEGVKLAGSYYFTKRQINSVKWSRTFSSVAAV